MRRGLILLMMIATVFVPTPASACSCAPVTESEALATSKVVFAGTLSEVRQPIVAFGDKELTYVFDVDTVVKGEVHERALMSNYIDEGSSCNSELKEGLRYMVYGDDPEKLSYHMCGPTEPIFANGNVDGKAPLPGGPDLPPDPRNTVLAVGAVGVVGALLLKWKLRDPLKH